MRQVDTPDSALRIPYSALVHTIRLREPWQIERLTGPPRVRFTRHFNRPTGLDGGERVWLVIAGLPGPATVRVNDLTADQASGLSEPGETIRHDITPLLAPRNKIEIVLPPASQDTLPASPGEVRLEIEQVNESAPG